MNATTTTAFHPALARYAKLVVLAAFFLIFTGGQTTTAGAGMAFPDWPLSNGSLNPDGWLVNFFMFLEHGHRLTAGLVLIFVTALFAWVCAVRARLPRAAFRLALWALAGVLAQAVLGGLRVVLDPQGIAAGSAAIAMTFRVLHGCFAQIELCLLTALAAVLSRSWIQDSWTLPGARLAAVRRLAWIVVAAIFCQLIVGAAMRHLGAGLAIPTFPEAGADGGWMPTVHNKFTDINFAHTRLGALVVTVLILALFALVLRRARGDVRLTSPATGLLGLVLVQLSLGMAVVLHARPLTLTTVHVINGAAILALSVLLALRAGRFAKESAPAAARAPLAEVRA